MRDTLDQDLATIARLIKTSWGEAEEPYLAGRYLAREQLGSRKWFKRCCGERMYKLHTFFIRKGTEHYHEQSRHRGGFHSRTNICLKCGIRVSDEW